MQIYAFSQPLTTNKDINFFSVASGTTKFGRSRKPQTLYMPHFIVFLSKATVFQISVQPMGLFSPMERLMENYYRSKSIYREVTGFIIDGGGLSGVCVGGGRAIGCGGRLILRI